ncbi:hypothetical protein N9K59_01615 [Candidatus Thioglobus sp.]|nr:hypothetical protein [Candidatus Thioglobus sp.]
MKNFKSLILLISLSIFSGYINAEVIIPSEDDKISLQVYLMKNPSISNPVFTTDIDNNLTISKTNSNVIAGKIKSSACYLNDLTNYAKGVLEIDSKNEMINFLQVDSMYANYGIENLAKILSSEGENAIVNFANSLGIELEVETACKDSINGNGGNFGGLNEDMFYISDYVYNAMLENSNFLQNLTAADVLVTWTFDEILALSNNYLEGLAEEEKGENEFMEGFTNLAEEKSKDYTGSLFIKLNDYGSPKFCTTSYSDFGDSVAVFGYRQMGDEMAYSALSDYYKEKGITLNYDKNQNSFDIIFNDISEAFSSIKPKLANNEDYCNIFIDYPENLLKLKNALERDLGVQAVIGNLWDRTTTSNQYALGQGYDNYEQYYFAYQIKANYGEIKSLENYQILNQSEFKKVQDEIVSTGYSNDTSPNNVSTYLDDLSNAQQQNMNVNEYRDARVEEEERLAKIAREEEQLRQAKLAKEEQLRRAEFAKEYPYTATLTCGMGGGDHINIFGCFAGSGSYGADTELEITNGQNYQMYKVYNLGQAGNEYRTGLEINLKESFKIYAQNSAEYLMLSLKIIDNATGATLYQDSAAQYGVISISN